MKNWKDKPMTWGSYVKFSGIMALISLPISILSIVIPTYSYEIAAFGKKIKRKFKK